MVAARVASERVELRPFRDLSPTDLSRWAAFVGQNSELDSPFFAPGYFAALERCGSDVLVAVTRAGGVPVSFLPLARHGPRGRRLRAAGAPGADFQGPISAPGHQLDVRAVLRAARATDLHFDHLRANADGFESWRPVPSASPYLDLVGGVDAYLERAGSSARSNLGQARRKLNQLVRDHGPVEVELASADPRWLDQVIELKRAQYRRTLAKDHFTAAAHRDLLHDLLGAASQDDVRGVLTVVRCGSQVVAGHFGMRRAGVLHWWFPVYDPQFARYAPGWLLLRALITAAPELVLARLDLGRGDAEYKRRAMTGEQYVHDVRIELNPLTRTTRSAARAITARVRSSRAAPVLKRALRGRG